MRSIDWLAVHQTAVDHESWAKEIQGYIKIAFQNWRIRYREAMTPSTANQATRGCSDGELGVKKPPVPKTVK